MCEVIESQPWVELVGVKAHIKQKSLFAFYLQLAEGDKCMELKVKEKAFSDGHTKSILLLLLFFIPGLRPAPAAEVWQSTGEQMSECVPAMWEDWVSHKKNNKI